MIHEIGLSCPSCMTADPAANMLRDGQSQSRSPNCQKCGGNGTIYRDPVLVRGIATNIRQQKNVLDSGLVEPGDMQFSIGPGFVDCGQQYRKISQGDKLTATWSQPLSEGQTIVRGASTMGENLRLANNVQEDEDRLTYEPETAIWCEDENQVVYTHPDFELGPGRVIKWVGKQPAIGTKYVIKYQAYFEWLVWSQPQERVDRGNRDLGSLLFLRKRHVAFINDSPFVVDTDRVSLSSRLSC